MSHYWFNYRAHIRLNLINCCSRTEANYLLNPETKGERNGELKMIQRPLCFDRSLISKESDPIVSTWDVSKCSNQSKSKPLCGLKIVCLYPALICNTDLWAFLSPRGVLWLNVCQRLQRGVCQEEKSLTEAASEKLWFVKGCLPRWKRCSFGNGNCLPNHLCNVSLMNVVNNVSARTTGNPPAHGASSSLRLSTQFEVWSGRRSLSPTDLSLSALPLEENHRYLEDLIWQSCIKLTDKLFYQHKCKHARACT